MCPDCSGRLRLRSGLTDISCSQLSLFVKKTDGSIWASGYDGGGQLGDGKLANVLTPIQVLGGGVTSMESGMGNSLFLMSDGSVMGVGAVLPQTIKHITY